MELEEHKIMLPVEYKLTDTPVHSNPSNTQILLHNELNSESGVYSSINLLTQ